MFRSEFWATACPEADAAGARCNQATRDFSSALSGAGAGNVAKRAWLASMADLASDGLIRDAALRPLRTWPCGITPDTPCAMFLFSIRWFAIDEGLTTG